ncbi:three-helix bundle dimerization domain-containing protein [Kribbella sp. NPDC055071]
MTELTWHRRADLSIDQKLAPRTTSARLTDEFSDLYSPETIERFLHSSSDQFATDSTIANFLPLLAEQFARQRLTGTWTIRPAWRFPTYARSATRSNDACASSPYR